MRACARYVMRACARSGVVVLLFGVLAACGGSSKPAATAPAVAWPAPADAMARARAAGLVPETAERLQYHVHSHLDVFVDGTPVVVPAGLGIDISNPGVHALTDGGQTSYGGIAVPCDAPCISPLHTHDATGVLHTESATEKDNTLGQVFREWNVRLDTSCVATYCRPATPVAVYVDGTKLDGDPTQIPLSNHKEIAVVVGTAPARVPSSYNWG